MEEKKYFKRLDYIRIASCIMVLLYHLNILKGGFLAVCTFFALSGYLSLTSALKNNNFSIKKYYISRIKKIYIPLLIVVLATVILAKVIPNITWVNLKNETTSALLGYNNFWQLSANLDYFTRHVNSPFMHLWYIAILLQFELIFPILFKILKKLDKKINNNISTIFVFLLLVVSVIVFIYMSRTYDIMIVYYNTFARCFSIIFGVFIALIYHKFNIKSGLVFKKYNTLIYYLYMILLIALSIFITSETKHYEIFMIIATVISVRLIEYSTIKASRKGNNSKIVELLSKPSYEIYLVQYPIIFFMQSLEMNSIIKTLLIIALTLIISIVLHLLLNMLPKKKSGKVLKVIIFAPIIIFGSYLLIVEKDNTKEMKELEDRLNENLKVIEQKNSEYMKSLEEEQKEWEETLKSMDVDEEKIAEIVTNLPVVGVGDSVMLGTIYDLYDKFPKGYFDGKVSRSLTAGISLLEELKNQGKLGNTVILTLTNNGDYSNYTNKRLMDVLEDRQVYWVEGSNNDDPKFNEKFREFAKDYDNIHLVEWEKLAKEHPEYLCSDGVHPNVPGMEPFAKAIYDKICEFYKKEYTSKKDEAVKKHEEETKNKIAFYGNDVLTNSFSLIQDKFEKAVFNAKSDYKFDTLYEEIKNKVNSKKIENTLVFIFDKELKMSKEEYQKIIDLCENCKIYICNISEKDVSFKNANVKVINFNSEIKQNKDYMMSDNVHLSKKGNEALINALFNQMDNKE